MKETSLCIKAVGDICPGDKSILGLGVGSHIKKHGSEFPLQYVSDQFKDADIVIGNLEGVLSSRANSATETFYGVPEFAVELKKAGFSVLNVANNHIMEKGADGFNDTITAIQEAGIEICGMRGTKAYYSKPVILRKKGRTIGIIAYNWVSVDLFDRADDFIAQSRDSAVNYTWNRDPEKDRENRRIISEKNCHVISDIKRLHTEADMVILIPHWGYEFVNYPPWGVVLEAHSFIDAGADVVIGIHPHVVQGVENYKNGIIAYSLGNFIFDSRSTLTRHSVLFELSLSAQQPPVYSLYPFKLNRNFQPVPLPSMRRKKTDSFIMSISQAITSKNAESFLDDEKLYKDFEKKYNYLKWHTIIYHFLLLPTHPAIIKVIVRKIGSFLQLIQMRLHGKRVRW